ncbi:MAG: IS3 family transposase, partial [bacterium]|nr:IS3 family transposase [bacterium]MDE0438988.1 IS3 family transposase [bacterium]
TTPCPRPLSQHLTIGASTALTESFWARMQVELLDRRRWRTRLELANAIFEYLEIFHNRQRRHAALGMRTPTEYERIHHDNNPTAAPLIQAS